MSIQLLDFMKWRTVEFLKNLFKMFKSQLYYFATKSTSNWFLFLLESFIKLDYLYQQVCCLEESLIFRWRRS